MTNHFVLAVYVLLGVAACDTLCTPVHAADAVSSPPGYKLVWSDEFDDDGLPDSAKWDYEEGYVRNHEAQFYTRAGRKTHASRTAC